MKVSQTVYFHKLSLRARPTSLPLVFDYELPPAALAFQFVPGSLSNTLDYTTNCKEEISLYSSLARSLYEDPANLLNVEADGLQTFLALFQHCGNTTAWDFDVP